ncbi:MAG: ABC transporter permease [Dehalococcoidia bacterium]|nr:ABC transporter permease [Dehalococcoidia bacterium]
MNRNGNNWWALLSAASLLARRRLRSDWRLQAAVAFGMVLAGALLASGVIYSAVLNQAALRHTLKTSAAQSVNLRVELFGPTDQQMFSANSRFVRDEVQRPLQPFLADTTAYIQSPTLFLQGREAWETPEDSRPRGPLQSMSGLEGHVQVVEGRLPSPGAAELEVALEAVAAQALDIAVGDTLDAYVAILGDPSRSVKPRVVGIIQATDPQEEYWFGSKEKLSNTSSRWLWAPMFTTEDALFRFVSATYGTMNSSFHWYFYLNKEGIEASQADRLKAAMQSAISHARSLESSSTATDLPEVLDRYKDRLVLGRLPLFVVIFLVVGTLMYYLFLVAGLLARERTAETALLKARGSTNRQIASLALVEGLFMAAPALALGPVLAMVMVAVTDRVASNQLGAGGLVGATFSWQAYLLGAAGALLAVAVIGIAAFVAAHRTIVEVRQSQARPAGTLLIQRRFLDVLLLAVVGFLWWQIRDENTFLVQRLGSEGLQLDFSLLLGPILGLVAIGLLLLRVFPFATLLVARLLPPMAPPWLLQASRRLARDPVPAGLLVLLLLLATGLGVVGATVSASLDRSQDDRVRYEVGADLRVEHAGGALTLLGNGPAAGLAALPGVADSSDVARADGWTTSTGFGAGVTVMAIDPESFTRSAWSRPDFFKTSLTDALSQAEPPTSSGIELPPDTRELTVWALVRYNSPTLQISARLQDRQGYFFDATFGIVTAQGWQPLKATVAPSQLGGQRSGMPTVHYEPPYSLVGIVARPVRGALRPGAIYLDDLRAVTTTGNSGALSDFQELGAWRVLQDYGATAPVTLESSESVGREGRRSVALTWSAGGAGIRGLRYGEEAAMPVLASPEFLRRAGAKVDDTTTVWAFGAYAPFHVVGQLDYFPTVYPDREAFVVVDISRIGPFAALHASQPFRPNGETWVRTVAQDALDGKAITQAVLSQGFWVYSAEDAHYEVATREADPLVTAGWSSLLALAFLTVVLASVSGLLLYSYIDAREHQTEYALLRTLGFSRRELSGVVWFNLAIIAGVGIGVGSLVGFQLGRWLLPLLEVAEGGRKVTPPMILETNWLILGVTYAALGIAAVTTVATLSWLLGRLEIQRVLRMGET